MNEKNELTPAEEQELSALIKASYPSPSGNMVGRVTEKISAIRAARKKRTSLFLRYGSIAACAVLIAGIALAVVPRITKDDAKIVCDSAAPEEKSLLYNMAVSKEFEECADGSESGGSYCNGGTTEEFNMLMFSADLDPENHPTSNVSKFADTCDEDEAVNVPEPSFMGRNDGLIPNLADIDTNTSPSALIDIDGDGEPEYCTVTPVSEPEFALYITASVGDEKKYEAVFTLSPCSVNFEKTDEQMLIRAKDSTTGKVTYYAIVADGNEIKLKPIV